MRRLYSYLLRGVEFVVTLGEGTRIAGFGSDVIDVLVVKGLEVAVPPVLRIGLADSFSEKYGLPEELVRACRLMLAQIAARTFKSLKVKDKLA